MVQQIDDNQLRTIITDPKGAETLVKYASLLGESLAHGRDRLSTSQIRALFGEVRQIEGEWAIRRGRALRRFILLRPKMAYRAKKERGKVEDFVRVLDPAMELVIQAPPREEGAESGTGNNQDDNFQRFVEFFEAILAYHKAYGGN